MLSLSRKQLTVLFIILVSFIITLVASMTILRAAAPGSWHQLQHLLPDIVNMY